MRPGQPAGSEGLGAPAHRDGVVSRQSGRLLCLHLFLPGPLSQKLSCRKLARRTAAFQLHLHLECVCPLTLPSGTSLPFAQCLQNTEGLYQKGGSPGMAAREPPGQLWTGRGRSVPSVRLCDGRHGDGLFQSGVSLETPVTPLGRGAPVLLKLWSLDQQCQLALGTFQKQALRSYPGQVRNPAVGLPPCPVCSPGAPDAHSRVRTTDLHTPSQGRGRYF